MAARLDALADRRRIALRCLAVDQATAEVAKAMNQEGIRPILLKGPSLSRWIYSDHEVRPYGDSDFLVSPAQRDLAQLVLEGLGYRRVFRPSDTPGVSPAADEWRRLSDGTSIDLHRTIFGIEVADHAAWNVLCSDTVSIEVADVLLEALSYPARALHIALHAAQHGVVASGSLRDLDHALAVVDEDLWREASALADRLGATAAFASGLRLVESGDALANRLRLTAKPPTSIALRARSAPTSVVAWDDLVAIAGWKTRIHFIARKIVPTPTMIRTWSPLASRGWLGLCAAYAWRPLWVLRHAWPGFAAWRNARRDT